MEQLVNFPTHNLGNTIDLVYSEVLSKLRVIDCFQGSFLTDHCAVICNTTFPRSDIERKKISYRKINQINLDEYIQQLDIEQLMHIGMPIV